MRALVVLLLASLPPAAVAQDFVPGPYYEILAECYADAASREARTACIGEASRLCMEEEPEGQTTMGMSRCTGIEADAWDVLLEGEMRATMEWAQQSDEADLPEFRDRAEALRDAQQAWEEFAVEECRLQYALWGSGSMRSIAGAACRMQMIAERAITLRALREEM